MWLVDIVGIAQKLLHCNLLILLCEFGSAKKNFCVLFGELISMGDWAVMLEVVLVLALAVAGEVVRPYNFELFNYAQIQFTLSSCI